MLVPAFLNEDAPAQALVLNLTTVNPDANGWLWVDYLDQSAAQATSGANYVAHRAVSNGFMAITEETRAASSCRSRTSPRQHRPGRGRGRLLRLIRPDTRPEPGAPRGPSRARAGRA
ncbi:hypothetical protein ACFQZC_02675 [Streptacidiphilus monticola]